MTTGQQPTGGDQELQDKEWASTPEPSRWGRYKRDVGASWRHFITEEVPAVFMGIVVLGGMVAFLIVVSWMVCWIDPPRPPLPKPTEEEMKAWSELQKLDREVDTWVEAAREAIEKEFEQRRIELWEKAFPSSSQ